ncbi:BON domain-containing protein [Pseudidiomarina sediminum]|uniref:BON domain-containing protein n=1 Tax=Pseudidiomarina sediminum TaxID=431675 RepID=A0A432Z4D4_9GAMM|nr:BON domain-containing protein [Pseudidiomarina sediminum]MBY6062903.1 BON domain-containing protein [Pseudidiomarina sediminum]RUO72703.1 BON domain-containing protein [Pseudidiomarina sediminum]
MKINNVMTSAIAALTLGLGTSAMANTLQDPQEQEFQEMQQQAEAPLSDAAITAQVQSALMSIDGGMNVTVETSEGVVTLSGSVTSDEQSAALERATRSVQGVQDVRNDLEIES